jgi:hypothetical protein
MSVTLRTRSEQKAHYRGDLHCSDRKPAGRERLVSLLEDRCPIDYAPASMRCTVPVPIGSLGSEAEIQPEITQRRDARVLLKLIPACAT